MPIKIPSNLPSAELLKKENIFVMIEARAVAQDIRPLKIAILNLMPNKEITETQILRSLANSPLQVEVTLLRTATYQSTTTQAGHLEEFYKTFDNVLKENIKFDGLIITGAPVERMDFENVAYWGELERIMKWAQKNVFSTIYICWAAQAALYFNFGIKKYETDKKVFGVFRHKINNKINPLVRGFDDEFFAPHSRHTEIIKSDLEKVEDLEIIAESEQAGIYLAASKNFRHVFVMGHSEYDFDTLHNEYQRDKQKGLDIEQPENYYPSGDTSQKPLLRWRAHGTLLFTNWLNYCVYQATPYNIEQIGGDND